VKQISLGLVIFLHPVLWIYKKWVKNTS